MPAGVNAAKYTRPRGRIVVEAHRDGNDVVVCVEDSGEGIPEELLPQVFDMFVQSRQTLARSQGGLGIGLAIVKSLVTMHGGRIFARSEGPGRGSTPRAAAIACAGGRADVDDTEVQPAAPYRVPIRRERGTTRP